MKKRVVSSFIALALLLISIPAMSVCVWDTEQPQNGWCTYNIYDGWACTAWGPLGDPQDCINGDDGFHGTIDPE